MDDQLRQTTFIGWRDGKKPKDQVRKGMPSEELERWLRPNLDYLPEKLPVGG